jgi:hypothetical protein
MKHLFIFLLTLFNLSLLSQDTYTVRGVVQDSLGMPLIAATTVVVNPLDSSLVTFGITDGQGNFELKKVTPGEQSLQITYIGYGTFQQKFTASGTSSIINLGTIMLSPDNNLIEEIVVKAKHVPLVIKKDTLEYNADAFKTRKSDAVEDLLRKLPGVEVERDGNIKVQGEDVEQVLVDGKEFFGEDPKIATQNLPAEIVDKVQVFDKQSEESEFSGIDDGNKAKTIDLKLKEDKKAGVFGTVMGGYGSDDRYTGKLQLNKFSSKMQASLIGNVNNVNNIGFSLSNMMDINPGTAFKIISSDGSFMNGGGAQGDNTAASSGINFNYDFHKNLKLRSSYFFNYRDSYLEENRRTENFLPDINYLSEEDNIQENNNQGHKITSNLEYDIDSTTELRIRSTLNLDDQHNTLRSLTNNLLEDASLISSANQLNDETADNLNYDGRATLRKRLKKRGRLLKAEFRLIQQRQDNNWLVDNMFSDIALGSRTYQEQLGIERSNTSSGSLSFTEPLAKNKLLTFTGAMSMTTSTQEQDFYDLGTAEARTFNPDLSDDYKKEYDAMSLSAYYRVINKKTNINLGLGFQSSQLVGFNKEVTLVDRSFQFILPSLGIEYDLGNGRMDFRYATNIREPSLSQLQPIVDNRNPLFVYEGNPNLQPTYNHNLSFSFNTYDQFNFRSIFGYINATYAKDYITTSRVVDENFITTLLPVNVDRNINVIGSLSYSTPLGWFPAKTRIGVNGEYNNGIAFINGQENDNIRKGAGINLRLENKNKEHFDFSVKGDISYTKSAFSQSEKFNTSYVNTGLTSALEIYVTDGFSFGSDFRWSRYSQERFSTTNDVKMWNAFVSTTFGESQRLSLDIELNDILNAGINVDRNATSQSISETTSSNLGRYGLVKISYSLSAFKPKNTFNIIRR